MENKKKVKGSFYLPEDIFKKVKVLAAEEGKRLNDVITEAVKKHLEEKGK